MAINRNESSRLLHWPTVLVGGLVAVGLFGPNHFEDSYFNNLAARPAEIAGHQWDQGAIGWPFIYKAVNHNEHQMREMQLAIVSLAKAQGGTPPPPPPMPKDYWSTSRLAIDVGIAVLLVLGTVYSTEVVIRRSGASPRITLGGIFALTGGVAVVFAILHYAPGRAWSPVYVLRGTSRGFEGMTLVGIVLSVYAIVDLAGKAIAAFTVVIRGVFASKSVKI